MFTLWFVIMLPVASGDLQLVYAEAPIERFETYDECVAWRDVLRIDAIEAGWDVSVALCERDATI
jgi:hypothetical protein